MLSLAQNKEREGVGIPGGYARRRQRAGRRQGQMAPPLARSSPPGKEESDCPREGKGLETEGGPEEMNGPERES